MKILVLGYLVRGPLGGLAWHHLQYVLGLARLGHDVTFLEDSEDFESCYDPVHDTLGTDPSFGLRFAADAFARLGLADAWAYYDAHRDAWLGPLGRAALARCATADLLLNVSGVNPVRSWLERVPVRAFIDTDPAFTQIRHLEDAAARASAAAHTHHFTFAANIGREDCTVPDDGFAWRATRQPIVLAEWRTTTPPTDGCFTTVMQWDSYPARAYGGRMFGMKSASFAPFRDLPQHAGGCFEIALGSASAPRDELRRSGWRVLDSREPTRDPWIYQTYLRSSLAEFGVAKHGYVTTRCGWFSERTAAYMASGRAAVVQDTGFGHWLPSGCGLHAFDDIDGALAGIEAVRTDPVREGAAARDLVAVHFDARNVLRELVDLCGSMPPRRSDSSAQLPA